MAREAKTRFYFTHDGIKGLPFPAEGRAEYFDTKTKGLALRVFAKSQRNPEGMKAWYLVYRMPDETGVKRFKLGWLAGAKPGQDEESKSAGKAPTRNVGPLSLAQARDAAADAWEKIRKGIDPAETRRQERQAISFSDLADRYIKEYAKPSKRSWQRQEWFVKKHLRPKLGAKRASAITFHDCDELIASLRTDRPVLANRTRDLLRRIFNWASTKRLMPANWENPAKGIESAKEKPRQKVLNETEFSLVWRALDQDTAANKALFRLRALTICRGQEVASMRGQDLRDEVGGVGWIVPPEVVKTDKALYVPLSKRAAQTILDYTGKPSIAAVIRDMPDQMIFPRNAAGPQGVARAARRLRELSGVDFTPHDLRRTGATWLAALGVPRLLISMLLGHAEGGVTGAVYELYDRAAERRDALQKLADHYDAVLARTSQQAEIIPLAARV